eukprot:m.66429 g.66429  ORF g.66429 m.66429 type:complete len:319 (+) comp7623_c0_seq3:120-1076(+)
MAFCTGCGRQAGSDDRFCAGCGRPLAGSSSSEPPAAAPAPSAPFAPPASSVPLPPPPSYDSVVDAEPPQHPDECCLCFDSLCSEPCAVFVKEQASSGFFSRSRGPARVCRHYLHKRCAEEILRTSDQRCPTCRAQFTGVLAVPRLLDDPNAWFAAVDTDGNGTLSRQEVIDALRAQLPVDFQRLEQDLVANSWTRWDPNNDGQLTKEELFGPGGLVQWMQTKFPRGERPPPPHISNKHAWFDYWDEDSSASIDQEELTRALIKTFNLSSSLSQVNSMRDTVRNVWCIFDDDGNGTIERSEFLAPHGLADTIIATLDYQ